MKILDLSQWYLIFLEKDKKNFFELFFYFFLCFLSWIYGIVIFIRNFLYRKKIIFSFTSQSKVVSIGNLSWSGSGKTSLSIWLYQRLAANYKIAVLRRGYGSDEGELLKNKVGNVYSAPSRSELAKKLETKFNLFILDDGFQHRSLNRDVDIVIMGSREFKRKHRLIPAYIFREPLSALRRADILLLNYKEEMENREALKKDILKIAPGLGIYFSQYRPKGFFDLKGNKFSLDFLKAKRLGAAAAIGYPQGFFNKLAELGLNVEQKMIYPDHHELSIAEFRKLEDSLSDKGINDLVITYKDKYHLPALSSRLNIFILEVELEIEDEAKFLKDIEGRLAEVKRFNSTASALGG